MLLCARQARARAGTCAALARRALSGSRSAQKERAASFSGETATLYAQLFGMGEPLWQRVTEALLGRLPADVVAAGGEGLRVLDLASGPGEPACSIAQALPRAHVQCTDAEEDMLTLSRARAATLRLPVLPAVEEEAGSAGLWVRQLDLDDLSSVPDASQDVVTVNLGLMFVSDLDGCLRNCRRILRSDGHFVGTVWQAASIMPVVRQAMEAVLGQSPPPPPINPLALKDAEALDARIQAAGFTELPEHGHGETHDLFYTLGKLGEDTTWKLALTPTFAKLQELQDSGKFPNAMEDARAGAEEAMKEFTDEHDGVVRLPGTYRLLSLTTKH